MRGRHPYAAVCGGYQALQSIQMKVYLIRISTNSFNFKLSGKGFIRFSSISHLDAPLRYCRLFKVSVKLGEPQVFIFASGTIWLFSILPVCVKI